MVLVVYSECIHGVFSPVQDDLLLLLVVVTLNFVLLALPSLEKLNSLCSFSFASMCLPYSAALIC
jgi:hypothetical protein